MMTRHEEYTMRRQRRLEAGRLEYGDRSYGKPVRELLREALEEYEDGPNWLSFVLPQRPHWAIRIRCIEAMSRDVWLQIKALMDEENGQNS